MVKHQYVFVITIPKNTTDTALIKRGSALSGILRKVLIDIPTGWQYAAGVQLRFGSNKILPTQNVDNTEKYYTGDNTDLDVHPDLELKEDIVEIYGENRDPTNDHNCVITMEVELI